LKLSRLKKLHPTDAPFFMREIGAPISDAARSDGIPVHASGTKNAGADEGGI
jgi:hypothetical protein